MGRDHQQLAGSTIVVKLGGSAGIDPAFTLDNIVAIWPEQSVVFVHGANAALDTFIREQGREPRFVTSSKGQVSRFTDQQAMDDLLAIYAGRVNKRLVEGLLQRGVRAVGLTGMDAGIVRGKRQGVIRVVENGKSRVLRGDFAGQIEEVNGDFLQLLLDNSYLPVLTPPAVSYEGEAINVDGDKLALQVALALRAETLIYLSNTSGLLADISDPESLINRIDCADDSSVTNATDAAQGRMKKKVEAGVQAVGAGIATVIFGDGRIPDPISRAQGGEGTIVTTMPIDQETRV